MVARTAGLLGIEDGPGADIYAGLAHHQSAEPWYGREIASVLQEWAGRFNDEFKLHVPEVSLRLDALPRSRYGHFRYGYNGFGLRGEVAINARYLGGQREPWEVLGTLLHELLHAWQQAHGRPGRGNYHNCEFRDKARDLGLVIDARGVTEYLDESAFVGLLRRHGVFVPRLENTAKADPPRGDSKMKKWSCKCTNVRCAVAGFRAVCLNCGKAFVRQD